MKCWKSSWENEKQKTSYKHYFMTFRIERNAFENPMLCRNEKNTLYQSIFLQYFQNETAANRVQ